jgi:hypothetical protein
MPPPVRASRPPFTRHVNGDAVNAPRNAAGTQE